MKQDMRRERDWFLNREDSAGTVATASPRDEGGITAPVPPRQAEAPASWERPTICYCDRPMDWRTRAFGLGGTVSVFLLVLGCALFTWNMVKPILAPPAPLVVNLLPLASPPDTPPRPREAPRPVEKHERQPTPPKVEPLKPPILPMPTMSAPPSAPAVEPPDPAPRQPETAAPRTASAPPAPQMSSNAPDTWEGRILACLQKFRRYPGHARRAHQQGVAYVRFRMNREGHILSSSISRTSGFPSLDQAALDTLRRADPLPAIPADRPDELDLIIPVEFLVNAQ